MQIQETVAAAANPVTGAGSATTVLSWMNGSEFGMWAGIVIGLVGLAVNFYYKRKNDRRAAEAHERYMSQAAAAPAMPPFPEIIEKDE